jgi:ClpP class serine protease
MDRHGLRSLARIVHDLDLAALDNEELEAAVAGLEECLPGLVSLDGRLGDEVVLSPHAVLGPVDPQLGQYPAASLLKVIAKKPIGEIDDETLILADVGEKAVVQLREIIKELLTRSVSPEEASKLAELLSAGTWTHDYAITFAEASRLGLKVRSDMPPEVLELLSLYPQPVRRQPSVEYLPIPRRAEGKNSGGAAG